MKKAICCVFFFLYKWLKLCRALILTHSLLASSLAMEEDMQTRTNPESNHERDRYEHEERKKN